MNDRFVFCLFAAARDQPEPERPNTASRGRIALYWSLGVTAAAAVLIVCGLLIFHLLSKKRNIHSKSNDESEKSSCSADDQKCENVNLTTFPAGDHSQTHYMSEQTTSC